MDNICLKLFFTLILFAVSFSGNANTEAKIQEAAQPAPKETKSDKQTASPSAPVQQNTDSFWKDFGVGLAVSTKLGKERSIEEAQLVNGIVRISSERQVVPRLMLEKHWYITQGWDTNSTTPGVPYKRRVRHGIFVGASLLGEKKLMDSIATGYILGFRPEDNSSPTHNLGIGISVEPYARVLGDGIERDKPLPTGETSIRYKEKNRTALILFYTYTIAK